MTENQIAREIVHAAYHIHTLLGPGLLESVYHTILEYELNKMGFRVDSQRPMAVMYDDVYLDIGFRPDLIVDEKVIIEVKSVEQLAVVHRKQLLTYLRIADKRLGLLVNFGAAFIKDGVVRIVNGLADE